MKGDKDKLVWRTEKRKVNDLIPYPRNPRYLTEKQKEQLKRSLETFGLVEIPAINLDGEILAGHQRVAILQMLGRGEELIDVRVPNRMLTKEEADEYRIRSNLNHGEWDWDILLHDFDRTLLMDWGFEEWELPPPIEAAAKQETIDLPQVDETKTIVEVSPRIVKCPACGAEFEAVISRSGPGGRQLYARQAADVED